MPALSTFADFQAITGPAVFGNVDELINTAQVQSYFLGKLLRGGPMGDSARGGTKIIDQIILDATSQYQTYTPYTSLTPPNPQTISTWQGDWRFSVGMMTWSDHEEMLNSGGSSDAHARFLTYKSFKKKLESAMWVSIINGMETELWAPGAPADMESATGTQPYSIPVTVNEYSLGRLFNGTDGLPTSGPYTVAWSTIENIDPTLKAAWVPTQVTYAADTTSPGCYYNLLEAFDKAFLKCKYTPLPVQAQHSSTANWDQMVIACGQWGMRSVEAAARRTNDTWLALNNKDYSVPVPVYKGVEFVYVPAIDTATIVQNTTTTSPYLAEGDNTAGTYNTRLKGPRFYGINTAFYRKVIHSNRYFYARPPMNPDRQPFNWIQYIDTWHQNLNRCRNRHFVVSPSNTAAPALVAA